jgi:hypothetical protein
MKSESCEGQFFSAQRCVAMPFQSTTIMPMNVVLTTLLTFRSIGTTQAYIDVNDEMKRRAVELI